MILHSQDYLLSQVYTLLYTLIYNIFEYVHNLIDYQYIQQKPIQVLMQLMMLVKLSFFNSFGGRSVTQLKKGGSDFRFPISGFRFPIPNTGSGQGRSRLKKVAAKLLLHDEAENHYYYYYYYYYYY